MTPWYWDLDVLGWVAGGVVVSLGIGAWLDTRVKLPEDTDAAE